MNIFAVDNCPVSAAISLCDKHIVKMLLESAQILCTVHRTIDGDDRADSFSLYRATHKKHPCTLWAMQSLENYKWLCRHAIALCEEYTRRYGKCHASEPIIAWCHDNPPMHLTAVDRTAFTMAMPDEFKSENPVDAYRSYYAYKQTVIDMRWTNRSKPAWLA